MIQKKQSTDLQKDKSDVLSLLLSLERLYKCCQDVLNTYSQIILMLTVSIEAQMLLLKLKTMKDRWNYHLPFKEACTVDFYDWSKKIEKMSQGLVGVAESGDTGEPLSEFCPSKHFLLDLYELLPEIASNGDDAHYYRETSVSKLLSSQERIRKQISKNWETYKNKFSDIGANIVDERIGGVLCQLPERSVVIRLYCYEVLQDLSKELYELYETPSGVIPSDQFIRLAERVINESGYGGRKAQSSARRDYNNLKNTTPEDQWEKRRQDEIDASIDVINEMKYGRKVSSFIGKSYDIKGRYAGLGRFLNSVRKDISTSELTDLLEQLFRIRYFREDMEQQEDITTETENQEEKPTQKDARAIYDMRRSINPDRPKLPAFFKESIRNNPEVVRKFYDTFHHCGFYIGRALLDKEKKDTSVSYYDGWKWKHVREAFINLGFIDKDSTKKGMAEFIEKVFPYLTADNIKRGFSNRGTYQDPQIFERYVSDIESEFEQVADLMRKTKNKNM